MRGRLLRSLRQRRSHATPRRLTEPNCPAPPLGAVRPSGTRDARDVTPDEWAEIIASVKGGKSLRAVAEDYRVSHVTIKRRVDVGAAGASRRGPEPRMSREGEAKLVAWLEANESIGKCVPMSAFKVQAARIAAEFGDLHFKAGRKFVKGFFNRHPHLSRRKAEVTQHSRLYAVHPLKVTEYMDKLEVVVKDLPAWCVWNTDESGCDIQDISNTMVVASKGAKQVQSGSGASRDRVSYFFWMNAAGDYSPPVFLLKGERVTEAKTKIMAAYPEAMYIMCESATQTEESWAQAAAWFNSWVAKKFPGGKHLVLVDGHSSRVSVDAINSFRAAGNNIFTLLANTTHFLQPFDVVIAKALKEAIKAAMAMIRVGDPGRLGRSINMPQFMQAFKIAYNKTMVSRVDPKTGEVYTLAERAFAKAGVYPFKRDVINERYSKPAEWFEANVVSQKPPPPPVPMDERAAIVEKHTKALLDAGDLTELLGKHVKAKREYCVPGATLLTGDEHIAKVLAVAQLKAAEDAAAAEKRGARKAASDAAKAAKLERAKAREAKATAKAAPAEIVDDATAPTAATAPAKAPKVKGVKRKREGALEVGLDEVEASRKGAGERRAARMAAREGGDE